MSAPSGDQARQPVLRGMIGQAMLARPESGATLDLTVAVAQLWYVTSSPPGARLGWPLVGAPSVVTRRRSVPSALIVQMSMPPLRLESNTNGARRRRRRGTEVWSQSSVGARPARRASRRPGGAASNVRALRHLRYFEPATVTRERRTSLRPHRPLPAPAPLAAAVAVHTAGPTSRARRGADMRKMRVPSGRPHRLDLLRRRHR